MTFIECLFQDIGEPSSNLALIMLTVKGCQMLALNYQGKKDSSRIYGYMDIQRQPSACQPTEVFLLTLDSDVPNDSNPI